MDATKHDLSANTVKLDYEALLQTTLTAVGALNRLIERSYNDVKSRLIHSMDNKDLILFIN